jgi:hypothetical protein
VRYVLPVFAGFLNTAAPFVFELPWWYAAMGWGGFTFACFILAVRDE